MDLSTWIAFALLETFLCLTPGPAVLFVVGTALGRGRRAGFSATGGIVTGNVAYFALSATSLGAILLASYQLFTVVRWVGAAYLVVLGVRAIVSRPVPASLESAPPRGPLLLRDTRASYAGGTITQLSNPKALVFFTALLPQFIDPHRSLVEQILILGVTSQAIEALVMTTYIMLANVASTSVRKTAAAGIFQRISGLFLVGAALKLALMKRT